jgi:hypothetical protein
VKNGNSLFVRVTRGAIHGQSQIANGLVQPATLNRSKARLAKRWPHLLSRPSASVLLGFVGDVMF